MHIGSQIVELGPFDAAFGRLGELVASPARGGPPPFDHLDLGGGLGIPYREDNAPPPLPTEYAEVVHRHVDPLGCEVVFEPGRLIAGNAGVLVARVIYVKEGAAKTFVILDAGMNDLIRPTLYDAWHAIRPVAEPARRAHDGRRGGPGLRDRRLPGARAGRWRPSCAGDLVAFGSAGAYGAVQASHLQHAPARARGACGRRRAGPWCARAWRWTR